MFSEQTFLSPRKRTRRAGAAHVLARANTNDRAAGPIARLLRGSGRSPLRPLLPAGSAAQVAIEAKKFSSSKSTPTRSPHPLPSRAVTQHASAARYAHTQQAVPPAQPTLLGVHYAPPRPHLNLIFGQPLFGQPTVISSSVALHQCRSLLEPPKKVNILRSLNSTNV